MKKKFFILWFIFLEIVIFEKFSSQESTIDKQTNNPKACDSEHPEDCVNNKKMVDSEELISFDYEVFGKVQGVYFRKYT